MTEPADEEVEPEPEGVQKPRLPYEMDALAPLISKETLEYHYGKHHLTYYNNLVKMLQGHEWEKKSLEFLVKNAKGGMFN